MESNSPTSETSLESEIQEQSQETAQDKDPVASLTEDLQRLQAEYANYRKRVDRDRALASEIAISGVLSEMLSILDDLDRASDHGELSGGFKAVADQVIAMTKKFGLEKFGEVPSSFDPTIHEALMHENSAEVTETTVTKILQPGYKYKERILRPARVVVTDPQ
ncbi:MAG: nucleotide exchange factor GrpE [Actinobacteria bacterium]|nr:nucleotide exchange factor GrpE [Actinomycetota bacterium]